MGTGDLRREVRQAVFSQMVNQKRDKNRSRPESLREKMAESAVGQSHAWEIKAWLLS